MLSRIVYFIRETAISLRRNISMTIAAVLTILVTLSLVGVSMLVYFWNAKGTSTVEKAVRFEVFMLPNAQDSQIKDVRAELEKDKKADKVVRYSFITKEEAYEFFKKSFKDDTSLVKSITAEALPVSFLAAPSNPEQKVLKDTIAKYEAMPGVDSVESANFAAEIRRARIINQTLAVFAFILLVASCVLVFNTVRLAVYARRREIEIMKLVGASNWFVQVPFMAEGATQGFVGGLFATVSSYGFKKFILDKYFNEFRGFYVTSGALTLTIIAVVFLGMAIGFVSSYIGLKRYLDV